jgi:NADH:ubiquinone oxidoreductase subunit 3 (subunit A)
MAMRELGLVAYFQIVFFFALLITGYIYVWRKGVFDWSKEVER